MKDALLDDAAIERYARQLVVPGIGAAGQRRLLSSCVLVVGEDRGVRQAILYLEAAGVRVTRDAAAAATADVVLVAGNLAGQERAAVLRAPAPLCWYVLDEQGFTSGVHPGCSLPAAAEAGARGGNADHDRHDDARHDAAACDAAALACAVLLGLARDPGPARFVLPEALRDA